jgi:hypothetical protein
MTFSAPSPEVEEELAAIRKAVDGLRTAAANHKPPTPLEASNAALGLAEVRGTAMQELLPLGFNRLGDTGETRKDGGVTVSRRFGHADGTICGWLGFMRTNTGPRLVVFLVTEGSGSAYCTSLRGSSGLSLARPPHVHRIDYPMTLGLAEVVRQHRERVNSIGTGEQRLSRVTTLAAAIDVVERLHDSTMAWRTSCGDQDLLRADLRSVLANSYRGMPPADFWVIYSHAAEWPDFDPPPPTEPSSSDAIMANVAWRFAGARFTLADAFDRAVRQYHETVVKDPDAWRPTEIVVAAPRVRISYFGIATPGDVDYTDYSVELASQNGESFTALDLLFKLHNAVVDRLGEADHCYFEGLLLKEAPSGTQPPLYELQQGS